MSIDQRGLKVIVQAEAQEFLQPQQLLLNHTVAKIEYDSDGVTVTITNGTVLTADYVLCTFSVGVLQNDDVVFVPELPSWKVEALSTIDMVCRLSALDLYLALIADRDDRPQKRRSTCNLQRSSGSTLRCVCQGYGHFTCTNLCQDGPLRRRNAGKIPGVAKPRPGWLLPWFRHHIRHCHSMSRDQSQQPVGLLKI